MSHRHVDSDVETAIGLREEMIAAALSDEHGLPPDPVYRQAFEGMRSARIYVWEPPAMSAFWTFWDDHRNYWQFMDEFVTDRGLIYRQDLACREFHMFPSPGRLFSPDLQPDEYRDNAAAIIFPPTTRAIGLANCVSQGVPRLSAIIQSIQFDPHRLEIPSGGMVRLDPMPALPPKGTLEAKRLVVHLMTRYSHIADGYVSGPEPLNWLMCVYQLQIFLLQPFVGFTRKSSRGKSIGKGPPQPAPEIVQVLMRKPLPTRVPKIVFVAVHPVTGRKLEFEVDVRGHTRHCASGKTTWVREHKRGPQGKVREKVIKVIR